MGWCSSLPPSHCETYRGLGNCIKCLMRTWLSKAGGDKVRGTVLASRVTDFTHNSLHGGTRSPSLPYGNEHIRPAGSTDINIRQASAQPDPTALKTTLGFQHQGVGGCFRSHSAYFQDRIFAPASFPGLSRLMVEFSMLASRCLSRAPQLFLTAL